VPSFFEIWTEESPRKWVSQGKNLRMDFNAPALVTFERDGGPCATGTTKKPVLGLHSLIIELPASWEKLQVTVDQGNNKRVLSFIPR